MLRTREFLVALAAMVIVMQWAASARWQQDAGVAAPSTTRAASTSELANAILSNVRRAEIQQFRTPESVVEFFLEQVKRQDVDEAVRAFPITEFFERRTFERSIQHLRIIDPTGPLPDQPIHNLSRALSPLVAFTRAGVALLGQPHDQIVVVPAPVDAERKPNSRQSMISASYGR